MTAAHAIPSAGLPSGSGARIFVQAASFSQPENAQRARLQMAALGGAQVTTGSVGGVNVYRVRLGPVATPQEADRLLGRLVGSGYYEARIVRE